MIKNQVFGDFIPVAQLKKNGRTVYFGLDSQLYAIYIEGERIHPPFKVYLQLWEYLQEDGWRANVYYKIRKDNNNG